ncbi:hypothetical protein [Streptomyces ochraceiscleroticus]|uniref:SRPBCC family protein n=1 Tax=Streptomyces ochraceiscleroticus TaxID=47761 RepID=A0ABW1MIU6_9ACTN|nr:hypothetical protein [Streptomyces ochraceiscleroticus]
MSDVRVSAAGDFPPATFIEALTTFGPERAKIWGNSSAGQLVVHDQGEGWADVTEGTDAGGIWQRYRYAWSPSEVRLDVVDSNAFGKGSYWLYRLTAEAGDQRTRIDLHIHRVPTTTKGKLFDPLLRLIGGVYFGRDLRRSVRRIGRLFAEKGVHGSS